MQDRDWTNYWRLLFKKVTVDDITSFEKSYKGSEEEAETLRSAYVDCEGDMEKILEEVCVCVCVCEPGRQQGCSRLFKIGFHSTVVF